MYFDTRRFIACIFFLSYFFFNAFLFKFASPPTPHPHRPYQNTKARRRRCVLATSCRRICCCARCARPESTYFVLQLCVTQAAVPMVSPSPSAPFLIRTSSLTPSFLRDTARIEKDGRVGVPHHSEFFFFKKGPDTRPPKNLLINLRSRGTDKPFAR